MMGNHTDRDNTILFTFHEFLGGDLCAIGPLQRKEWGPFFIDRKAIAPYLKDHDLENLFYH